MDITIKVMVPALTIRLRRAEGMPMLLGRTVHLSTAWNGMSESSSLGQLSL